MTQSIDNFSAVCASHVSAHVSSVRFGDVENPRGFPTVRVWVERVVLFALEGGGDDDGRMTNFNVILIIACTS